MKDYKSMLNMLGMPLELTDNIKARATFRNTKEFEIAFARYYMLAFGRFRMKEGTCPDTMDERTAKNAILTNAKYCRWLQEGKPLGLPCNRGGSITFYGYSNTAFVFARNGWNKEVKLVIPGGDESNVVNQTIYGTQAVENEDKGFIIRANELEFPLISFITSYAWKVSDTMRALDVQRNRMKTPGFVVATEELAAVFKKIQDQLNNNEEIINVPLGARDALQTLDYIIPSDIHHETKADYEWYDHLFLNILGFGGNASPDKGAQLTEDEVHSDSALSAFSIQNLVNELNKYEKVANEVQGTNIEWEVVEPELPEKPEQEEKKESEEVEDE